MTNMCRRMLCQLLLMLTFCFLLVPAMRNANNRNVNSTDAYDSDGRINGTGYERYNADDLNDLYGGHHNDHAEPSTSNSQNVLSSEPSGPKNDSEDENVQKAIEESLKERNNAKNANDKLKMVKKQSEVDEYVRLTEQPSRENEITTRQELPNESDGLNKMEEEALGELIDGKGKALSKLNEKSRLKVLNAANKLGMDTSAFGHQPSRENEITTRQETPNELKVRNVAKNLGVEESSTSAVGQQSRLKVLNAANKLGMDTSAFGHQPSRENEITTRQETPNELKVRNVAKKLGVEESSTSAVGQQPQRENEITTRQETPNESDGLGDLKEEALKKLNEKVLSKLNKKSRLKVLVENCTSDVDQQTKGAPVKVGMPKQISIMKIRLKKAWHSMAALCLLKAHLKETEKCCHQALN
uniref:Secreted protein n=1 Tax=Globodera pallida TaxID=36090 RepID=A0A183BXX3_GLOPA